MFAVLSKLLTSVLHALLRAVLVMYFAGDCAAGHILCFPYIAEHHVH
jgi:hypothetical protein